MEFNTLSVDNLTSCQKQALKEFEKFLISDYSVMFIEGPAGTGKSTLLQELLHKAPEIVNRAKEMRTMIGKKNYPNEIKFRVTASTHAAVLNLQEILRNKMYHSVNHEVIKEAYNNVCTFHSFLQVKPQTNTFSNSYIRMSHQAYGNIIIVDEFSYIPFSLLRDFISKFPYVSDEQEYKILFIGDSNQLKVHNDDLLNIYDDPELSKYAYPRTVLKTVVRNTNEDLNEYIDTLKEVIQTNERFHLPKLNGVRYVSEIEMMEEISHQAALAQEYSYSPDDASNYHNVVKEMANTGFISFTNKRVLNMFANFRVAARVNDKPYGVGLESDFKYVPKISLVDDVQGQVINKRIITPQNHVIKYNSNCKTLKELFGNSHALKYALNNDPLTVTSKLNIFPEMYDQSFYIWLTVSYPKNTRSSVDLLFSQLEELGIKSGHTLNSMINHTMKILPSNFKTIHSSQGDTYERVYIDLDSFFFNSSSKNGFMNYSYKARLLYVAMTRAKKEIVFVTNKRVSGINC